MKLTQEYSGCRRAEATALPSGPVHFSPPQFQRSADPSPAPTAELRHFDAEILMKRAENWAAGKAILLDRQPRTGMTRFAHCLNRHTIALHLEGANTSTTLRYEGGTRNVSGSTIGQIMLIPAGHRLEGAADYPSRIRHVLLLLDRDILDGEDDNAFPLNAGELPYRHDLKDGAVASQMRALQGELDRPGPLSRLLVESLCYEITIRTLRLCSRQSTSRCTGGLAPWRLRLVKDYIQAHLSDSITLSDLAGVAGVSRSHFSRAFLASTGIGAHRYIVRQRVEQAKKLLAGGKMSIAEIALAAGFGNQSHLTTRFRREVGTTPARFRNLV